MTAGGFAGKDQLKPDVEAAGHARLASKARVLENENAALRFLLRQTMPRLQKEWAQIVVMPEDGSHFGPGLGWNDRTQHFPKRRRTFGFETTVELLPLGSERGLRE